MGKPRMFIHIHYLEIGGAETSLIGLLQALDPKRVDVDLFLNDHRGEMMSYIPDWVHLLPPRKAYTMIERPIKEVIKAGCWSIAAARLWAKLRFWWYARTRKPIDGSAVFGYVGRYVTPLLPSLKRLGEYDLAISFVTPHNIVRDKVLAKKKICWIHTDYTRIDVNTALERPVWGSYDRIVSISDDVARNFCHRFPSLADKMVKIEHLLSPQFIRRRADAEPRPTDMPPLENGYVLLTIGRYCAAKKLEDIPNLCRRLNDRGLAVKWYIIGYGGSDAYIREAIAEQGMENQVFLLGKRTNPYPYIKACDWYVQPSRYEGKSVVVREAQILGKPVIITAYPTAASQVQNGVDGIIVPLDVEACAAGIAAALTDEPKRQSITAYLASHDYGNENEVEKIYSLTV